MHSSFVTPNHTHSHFNQHIMKHDTVENQRISLFVDPDVLTLKEENILYNLNDRYRELLDKDDEGIATDEENEELREIFQEAVRRKKRGKWLIKNVKYYFIRGTLSV